MTMYEKLFLTYKEIQKQKPIVLNLTNTVTQDFMANSLLALGASPIMSEDIDEIDELITISQAININIGTLNNDFNEKSILAAKTANDLNKPIVLDPVGAGATRSRTNLAITLSKYSNIIRGNASEIISLGSVIHKTAGVDSIHDSLDSIAIAKKLSKAYNNIIVISGKTDFVISPKQQLENSFGISLMTRITGMGCSLSAVIAAFAAAEKEYVTASHLALAYYTLCAEYAYKITKTPAKFKIEFIDNLYQPNWAFIEEKLEQK